MVGWTPNSVFFNHWSKPSTVLEPAFGEVQEDVVLPELSFVNGSNVSKLISENIFD